MVKVVDLVLITVGTVILSQRAGEEVDEEDVPVTAVSPPLFSHCSSYMRLAGNHDDHWKKTAGYKRRCKGIKGFVEFIRKQGVVGLAIGFIVGLATAAVAGWLVKDLINPPIGLIVQTKNLDALVLHLGKATFSYSAFISALIDSAVILAVIYLLFKATGLEKLDIEEEKDKD